MIEVQLQGCIYELNFGYTGVRRNAFYGRKYRNHYSERR